MQCDGEKVNESFIILRRKNKVQKNLLTYITQQMAVAGAWNKTRARNPRKYPCIPPCL